MKCQSVIQNEDTYGRFDIGETAVQVDYGVVVWKCGTSRWFRQVMKINVLDDSVKRVFERRTEGRMSGEGYQ